MQARERKIRLGLNPYRGKYLYAATSCLRADRREQRRLPDPRLTADHERTAGQAA